MKLQSIVAPLFLLGTVSFTGCAEYDSVEAACHEDLPGGKDLGPIAEAAMLRVNCYRRLTGLSRGTANTLVQEAADAQANFVRLNPDYQRLLSSSGETDWLSQEAEAPGYTGNSVYERLTSIETGGAGYTIFDESVTGIWEFIKVEVANDPADLKSGREAIDELMRDAEFRQSALQPSWTDGAYAEADLGQEWFIEGGYENIVVGEGTATGDPENPITIPYGRVHYMVVIYQAPHFEHVDRPVLLPKEDQIGVPLYSWSENRDIIQNGSYARTQVSYPITLTMGSVDPDQYEPVDQNQYSALITGASIVDTDGNPLETEVVHPGDDPEEVWPSGEFQRTTLAVFSRHPLEPSSDYQVFIDLQTPQGEFFIDYSFRTANEDPGVDPDIGLVPPGPVGARRSGAPKSLHTFVPKGGFPRATTDVPAPGTSGVAKP